MKNTLCFLALMLCSQLLMAQFDTYFHDRTLRIDYTHAGTATREWYALDQILAEPFWGGSKTNLIDTLYFGKYFFEAFDKHTGELIYSRGYGSLFGEWQTTDEAGYRSRSFQETVIMPYPKHETVIVFSSRNRQGISDSIFSLTVDPDDYFIKAVQTKKWPVFELEINAPTEHAVDIVLLPDGYTAYEMDKFIHDSQMFAKGLFSFEPFTSLREKFNIRLVLAVSNESGAIIPADSIWPSTLLSSSFYTFDSERYCMTAEHKKVRDLAAHVPYDQIFVLLNSEKYGGGGIYNFYCLSTVDHPLFSKVAVHEFGHGFAGLGDEYFDSSTAYGDFYNLEIEPWEPNLTTLIDFGKKWTYLIEPDTPVPTPDTEEYNDHTGVFEGGGYVSKGMYRPSRNCLMNSFESSTFCAACNKAIKKMVRFYTD